MGGGLGTKGRCEVSRIDTSHLKQTGAQQGSYHDIITQDLFIALTNKWTNGDKSRSWGLKIRFCSFLKSHLKFHLVCVVFSPGRYPFHPGSYRFYHWGECFGPFFACLIQSVFKIGGSFLGCLPLLGAALCTEDPKKKGCPLLSLSLLPGRDD